LIYKDLIPRKGKRPPARRTNWLTISQGRFAKRVKIG
jgi:hypothetical protein